LALALYLALLFTNYSNAQVDSTTGNLINYGTTLTDTTSTWNNGVYVNQLCFQSGQPGNCGPNPSIRPGGSINFSYGTTDLNQVVNINRALAAGGTGVQLSGFNFSFTAKNGNGWDDGRQDYLAAYVKLYNSAGAVAANYDYSAQTNQRYNWSNFSFNETFASPQLASQYSNAQVGFIGRDNNFWAGNYGPEIYNVSFSLKYRVDPCALNPAYSPNCANFNTVATSNNLVPNPNGYAVYGDSINQSYAINTALASAGSAAQIHGFQWGYTANANSSYCAFWVLVCFDERIPKVQTHVNITNSSGASLYSVSRNYENSYNDTNYSYLFPSSQTMSTLGNFNFSATTYDQAYIGNMYSRALYTADPCAVNPLSSPTCSGYGAAYAKLMASTSTTSSTTTAYTGTTSVTSSSFVETSPTGVIDQTSPQTTSSSSTSMASASTATTQDTTQATTTVATADPAQPASTTPGPAGGPAQTTTASSSSTSSGSASSSAGPSKLAMSVLKSAQEKDKATQNAAVQAAAKTLEGSMQSSLASSNLAISLNQDMSANSAVAAAAFASQTTQASQQTATQSSQGPQQTAQTSTQTTTQSTKLSSQEQQSQQETQQAQVQSSTSVVRLMQPQQETQQAQNQSPSVVRYQPPQQQEQQQAQSQSSSSVVKLLPPQQQEQQQTQTQMTAGMMTMPQSTYTPPHQTQDTQSTQVTALKPPTPPVVEFQQQASSGTGLTITRNMFAYNPLTSSNSSTMSLMPQQVQPMYQPRIDTKQFEVDTPQMPVASFSGSRAGNPLSEIMMQQRFEMMQNNVAQPTGSVNKNVQPNELAGKVDITTMAAVPAGFNAYSIVLKDAAFYEPKEVYKNQRTVDNERVLRGLTRGSDSLHQQMVDQQYKVGN